MKIARAHSRWHRDEGQALTEFAIVVPVIVLVLMFSVWFGELVTIKLKTQEAARYTAWEVTAYKMHDYGKGPSSVSSMSNQAIAKATKEASRRYADLNSTTTVSKGTRIFSAKWTKPLIVTVNQQEEAIYGGAIVNFIFNVAAAVLDVFSALQFKNGNVVAMALVALGKDYGGARTARMFGSSEWGFNKSGYVTATVFTMVENKWWNRGVGRFFMKPMFVSFQESHGVLADTWNLYDGSSVYTKGDRPGLNKGKAYWKQVDRIYFVNKRTRGVGKTIINGFKIIMRIALAMAFSFSSSGLNESDFMQTSVVSNDYGGKTGQVELQVDRGQKKFDSSPACGATGACPGGDSLKPYGETLKARGKYFMGCKIEMQLGCPSSTLNQGNPFGDYLDR